MKDRQRWQAEEDTVLHDYVKEYGPRDWHLVSQRMGTLLDRDAKSCVERWKNYLKPGIKKGPLTEEEQQLVISLQAKYGNKWKKIAAEVPGRTAKRLGKWWEVYKDKQQKEKEKERPRFAGAVSVEGTSNYSEMLANLADKFGHRPLGSAVLPTPPFPIPPHLAPPPIAPVALIGTPMAGGSSGPSSVGILTSKLPLFDLHSSLPLATLAVPVSASIGSWLSTAISISQSSSMATPTFDSDVKTIPMEMASVRTSQVHPAAIVTAKTTQGPTIGPASDGAATSGPQSSQPPASGGSSSLPAWMSNVPTSSAQTPAVGVDGQSATDNPPSVTVGGASASGETGPSVAHDSLLSMSLSLSSSACDAVVPSAPLSDPSFLLAQRAWLQATLSKKDGGPSSGEMAVDAVVNTQAAWCPINPQTTGQMSNGPNLVLCRSMPPPGGMTLGANHWLKFLELCKELEEGRQYWIAQKKESNWRLKRLEAKLESEKMHRRNQKMKEVEASIVSLRAEESKFFEGLEASYKEKVLSLHREEDQKDAKLVEMWTTKHNQLTCFVEQMIQHSPPLRAPGAGPPDYP